MKKLVRLTESDLHRIVENSVRRTLNELDWRTYDSAMRKAANNKDYPRAGRFGMASRDAFNRDYGTHETPYDYNYRRNSVPFMSKYEWSDDLADEDTDGDGGYYNPNKGVSNAGYYDDSIDAYSDGSQCGDLERVPYGNADFRTRRDMRGKVSSTMRGLDKDYDESDNDDDFWANRGGEGTRADAMQAARRGINATKDYLSGKTKYKNGKWSND